MNANIEWTGKRCILCLKEVPLSREHIIPKAIGGILTCSFLCKECNSSLGIRVDAEVKKDPRIRFAVANLQSDIPDLAYKFMEGQPGISQVGGWPEQGKFRKGEFRVTTRRTKEGALIQPSDEGYKSNERILRKYGIGETHIQEALRRLDEAEENEVVELAPNRVAVKRSVEKVELDPRGSKLLTPLFPLKIGYEFLAFHLGPAIYRQDSALEELRVALRQGIEDHPSFWSEECVWEHEPFHLLSLETNHPYARVLIKLFGGVTFRVHFRRLAINHSRFGYKHDLTTGRDEMLPVDAS